MVMTRTDFREKVLERDKHRCVICGDSDKLDAHHIIERRLWEDGGYYLDNGATLCDKGKDGCHYAAETTFITVEQIREAAGIKKKLIPEDMYSDIIYDKWGNIITEAEKRSYGPLMDDTSVQNVLLDYAVVSEKRTGSTQFIEWVEYVKYPRTHHLPWSQGITDDDRVLKDFSHFEGKEVVVTVKMDGENFSGYKNYCHARSIDSRHHYTRDWAKNFWMQRSYELPSGWRVCAENLYAVHSIKYHNLSSYLLGFSIWNDKNECLSWPDTKEWFQLLGMDTVDVLYQGIWDEKKVKACFSNHNRHAQEGYVVRVTDSFKYKDFRKCVAKFVRKDHVQSQKHWFYGSNNHDINLLISD